MLCALQWSDAGTARRAGSGIGKYVQKGGVIFFLIWQKTALNQRSGMILEVQIQIFGASDPKNKNHSTLMYNYTNRIISVKASVFHLYFCG